MSIIRQNIVTCLIGRKTAIWIPVSNKYILVTAPVDAIVKLILEGRDKRQIVDFCLTLGLSEAESLKLENELRELLSGAVEVAPQPQLNASTQFIGNETNAPPFSKKHYRLIERVFRVEYASAETELMIHPKFAHLEIPPDSRPDHSFTLSHCNGHYGLRADGEFIGAWPENQGHVFSGQFSMQLLEKAYRKTCGEWMAVLHAAGVSNGRHCLIFAGDSGAGKSTIAALLMSQGLDVLADDFLPVESATAQVRGFPAAISVKEKALDLLLPSFPELGASADLHSRTNGKTVRYLPVERDADTMPAGAVCGGLIFANYDPAIDFQIEKIPPEDAFARLVPDSWIHPSPGNARRFLEWFSRLPCYRLAYSDNKRMVESLGNMLNGLA